MPVKAENLARYPKDWPQIVARIRLRAGNRCENCGVPNHALGGRTRLGQFKRAMPMGEDGLVLKWPEPGSKWWCGNHDDAEWLRIIRIVCTTAHLDHTPENSADDNLRYWCQRCHLRYDAKHHAETVYQTRRQGKAVDMFSDQPNGAACA